MKIRKYGLLAFVAIGGIFLISTLADACPNCFGSTDKKVLYTYYVSAIFLSIMPFAIIGSIAGWLLLQKRRIHSRGQIQRNTESIGK